MYERRMPFFIYFYQQVTSEPLAAARPLIWNFLGRRPARKRQGTEPIDKSTKRKSQSPTMPNSARFALLGTPGLGIVGWLWSMGNF
jgi:hypothetical protein